MPRIPPVSQQAAGPFARFTFRAGRRRVGKVPETLSVMAHHGPVLAATGAYELALERSTAVDARLKELAPLKAAAIVECAFCLDIGSWLARDSGIGEAQLLAIAAHHGSEAFSPLEHLVLDYAEAMTRAPVQVPEALTAALREHFDERALVELTATIAWENFRARFNAAAGIESQDFSEGAACALPERAATTVPL